MLITDLIDRVKTNLNIVDTSRDLTIKDILQDIMNYCNLPIIPIEYVTERDGITVGEAYDLIDLPIGLEPYVRKKTQAIINYEAENGTTSTFDIKTLKEGDTSITYNIDSNSSRETIYSMSDADKKILQKFRRLR